jgi:hypothetical protein
LSFGKGKREKIIKGKFIVGGAYPANVSKGREEMSRGWKKAPIRKQRNEKGREFFRSRPLDLFCRFHFKSGTPG